MCEILLRRHGNELALLVLGDAAWHGCHVVQQRRDLSRLRITFHKVFCTCLLVSPKVPSVNLHVMSYMVFGHTFLLFLVKVKFDLHMSVDKETCRRRSQCILRLGSRTAVNSIATALGWLLMSATTMRARDHTSLPEKIKHRA